MKRVIILITIASFIFFLVQGMKSGSRILTLNDTIHVYKFKNKYLNLNLLKLSDTVSKNAVEIKRENIHSNTFVSDENDFIANYKSYTFKLNSSREISILDNKSKLLKTIADPDKNIPLDNTSGNSLIFTVSDGVVLIQRLSEEEGYHIKKYDENGTLLNSWTVAHTIYKKYDNTVESIPHLYYFAHTSNEIIFSSMYSDAPKETVVLSIADGTKKTIEKSTGGIIVNQTDKSLAGLIHFDDHVKTMEVEMGSKKWQTTYNGYDDAAKTVLSDSILVIAIYDNIATGCAVNAYNAYTGTLLWKGDVKQLMVGHSEYYNMVYLTVYKNMLILEGNEAGGDYLQVFDLKTGKRLFEEMPDSKE